MYPVTDEELDALTSHNTGIHLGFLGISVGVLIAFGITLVTVLIPDPKVFAAFIGLSAVGALATAFFGFMAFREYRRTRRHLQLIKGRS